MKKVKFTWEDLSWASIITNNTDFESLHYKFLKAKNGYFSAVFKQYVIFTNEEYTKFTEYLTEQISKTSILSARDSYKSLLNALAHTLPVKE
jgi:hypothetical protein